MNELWPHQKIAKEQANVYDKRALFWEPRLGKTQGTIEVIKQWATNKGIIVAPLLVCPQWSRLLRANGIDVLDCYEGPLVGRRASIPRRGGSEAIVINYDAVKPLIDPLLRYGADFVIADESHWIKSPSAARAKSVRRLAWAANKNRLLTGTPTPNHYGDLWGQMSCIDPDEWSKAYGKFADRHLIRDSLYPSKIVGYNDLDRINRLVDAGSHIVRREDVFGPDEFQFVRRNLRFEPSTARLYKQLSREWVLSDPNISAEHILKRLVRLQQLTSGYLPSDEGGVYQEIHSTKLDAVMGDLDEIITSGEKVIIFHRFTWEGQRYVEQIRQSYPRLSVHGISGSSSLDERQAAIDDVASNDGPVVVVAQARAGGIGISFAEATHAMIVSSDYSFTERKQAIDRIYKPGARRVVTSYVMENSIDTFIEKALACKQSIQDAIMSTDKCDIVYGPSSSGDGAF